jgi:hypothetical protein
LVRSKSRSLTIGFVALGALTLAAFALAACGGDDDKGTSTATTAASGSAATTAASGSSKTAAGGSATAASSASPGSGQVTGSGADALKALAKDLTNKTYKVSYDMTLISDEETTKGVLTLYHKPPKDAFSFNITDSPDGAQMTAYIDDGKNTLTCFGETATEGTCLKATSDGTASPFASVYSADAILSQLTDSVEVTDAGSKTIAGADSKCFNVKEQDGSVSVACFSKSDGLLTSVQGTNAGDTTKIVATSISTSVDDSVFSAPKGYDVQDTTGG